MSSLIIGLITGIIAMVYCFYGKKQRRMSLFLAGLALGIYPYFISNPVVSLLIGAALAAVPFFTDN